MNNANNHILGTTHSIRGAPLPLVVERPGLLKFSDRMEIRFPADNLGCGASLAFETRGDDIQAMRRAIYRLGLDGSHFPKFGKDLSHVDHHPARVKAYFLDATSMPRHVMKRHEANSLDFQHPRTLKLHEILCALILKFANPAISFEALGKNSETVYRPYFAMPLTKSNDLQSSLGKQYGPLRPILTSVNGDATWLISFPQPTSEKQSHKQYFHILTDPWLKGDTCLLSSWFIRIARSTPTAAADGAGVESIVRDIETAASQKQNADTDFESILLDAILVNMHYLDHMHRPTLLTFDRKIPVFAAKEAHPTISSWGHFERVIMQADFEPDMEGGWQSAHPGNPMPTWLSVFRLKGDWELNFATVAVWSHEDGGGAKHEALLLTPHGIKAEQSNLQSLFCKTCEPPVSPLAMLAALKDSYSAGMRTTLGMPGTLALERSLKPKYWVRMHDSYLSYGGIMSWLLWTNDIARTLDDGLKEEAAAGKSESRRPNLIECESGGHLILA